MNNRMLILSDTTAAAGVGLGLANIYTILGIILICVNIGILILNFILRMIDRFRNKNNTFNNEARADAAREILELAEEVQRLQEELSKYDRN